MKFDKRYFPQLCIDQPRLWWPNGYGEPNLYHCKFEVMVDGRVSETKDVSFGIKKYSYDKETSQIVFKKDGMQIDFGGIAKGYTSARIMDIFRACGIKSGLVNLGGNVQALGTKKDGSSWRVAVQDHRIQISILGCFHTG